LLLSGCDKGEPVAWEAQKEMKVFVDPEQNSNVVKFMLVRGDICVPGREAFSKAFAFREVVCPRRGVGWVAATEFKVFDAEHPEGKPLMQESGRSYP
jgi:hypothetical protein